jgi:ubiquinol-cytochrome c reductase subunit 6
LNLANCVGIAVGQSASCVTQGIKSLDKTFYERKMWFEKFIPKVPAVKAEDEAAEEEEDLVDPQQVLRDKCNETEHCKQLAEKYQTCNDRVNSRSKTTENCTEELFDLLHAVDHCVTKELFSKLK